MPIVMKIFREPNGKLPTLGNLGDAGLDCYADISEDLVLTAGQSAKIPLGFRYSFWRRSWGEEHPENNMYMEIANRSGFGTKEMVTELARICDASYRGVPHYSIAKIGGDATVIKPHQKVCQAIIHPFADPRSIIIEEVSSIEELGETRRGAGGFNSSGSF